MSTTPKEEFMIYYPANEGGQGCYVKLIDQTDPKAPNGIYLQRYRSFQGKSAQGFSQKILRDPSYIGIDTWAKKFGLPALEFCPEEWLDKKLATFESGFEIAPDEDTLERAYARWVYIRSLKEARVTVKNKVTDKAHKMFSPAQFKEVDDLYTTIQKNWIAKGFQPKGPAGAASHEVCRQEIANVHRAILVAITHCEKQCNQENGKTLRDFKDAIFEREKQVLNRTLLTSGNPQEWDSITEMIDTPQSIGTFFGDLAAKPWAQLSEAQKKLFETHLKRV